MLDSSLMLLRIPRLSSKDIDSCTHLLCSLQSVFLVFVLLRLRVLLVLDPWHWCDSSPVRQTISSNTTSRNLKYPCPDYSPDSSCSSCCVCKINLHTNISVSWYTSVTEDRTNNRRWTAFPRTQRNSSQ